jgi:hypothetical protein
MTSAARSPAAPARFLICFTTLATLSPALDQSFIRHQPCKSTPKTNSKADSPNHKHHHAVTKEGARQSEEDREGKAGF